jgi:hypothetical protein
MTQRLLDKRASLIDPLIIELNSKLNTPLDYEDAWEILVTVDPEEDGGYPSLEDRFQAFKEEEIGPKRTDLDDLRQYGEVDEDSGRQWFLGGNAWEMGHEDLDVIQAFVREHLGVK